MSEETSENSPPEAQTSESAHDKGGFLWIVWLVMALLLAYPLSLGPVGKYYRFPRQAPDAVVAFYKPLKVLHKVPPAYKAMLWYLDLWGVQ